ncbi:hypothetical protein EZL74_11105 [Flavobacterium silvisoli]|uniref:Uncharacterized protein n=1 Tax=Flavobacterium silvisoli TaxID=2529433 RepID=A0A4Q9YRI3_9FLAO|nr:hypothetical protein [Flavobacterium silvisoli]TBX66129.1 hypothetical protein EZL74_11105 [Flavobacterium silvisoli]
MKLKRILLLSIISCISLYILYVFILFIFAFGHGSRKYVEVPKELKEIEKKIQLETYGGNSFFGSILKEDIEKCHYNLDLYIYIYNDSISKSKELLDNYVNTVNKRVNEKLKDKKCIDSLIIMVTSDYSKAKIDSLKSKRYRYSFPIN